jgi:aminoglycoside phosphotransferase (APT) family kinase protein
MAQPWSAEAVVSDALARSLIEAQFPALTPAGVALLGAGWDNTAFRVNGTYVFRFPRRQVAVPLLETEARLLPFLAPRLPLPVPAPTFLGRPTDEYPWPFAGYRMLPGRTACTAALTEADCAAAAVPLARFLAALHAVPAVEAVRHGAGPDRFARLDLARQLPRARETLDQLVRRGLVDDPGPYAALLETAPATYAARADTVVHGDLYARHLLVDSANRLAGVIDWGDVHLGDPAADLAVALTFLPPAAQRDFRETYGAVEEGTWTIARLRALRHSVAVLAYGDGIGDGDLVREAHIALRHLAGARARVSQRGEGERPGLPRRSLRRGQAPPLARSGRPGSASPRRTGGGSRPVRARAARPIHRPDCRRPGTNG